MVLTLLCPPQALGGAKNAEKARQDKGFFGKGIAMDNQLFPLSRQDHQLRGHAQGGGQPLQGLLGPRHTAPGHPGSGTQHSYARPRISLFVSLILIFIQLYLIGN